MGSNEIGIPTSNKELTYILVSLQVLPAAKMALTLITLEWLLWERRSLRRVRGSAPLLQGHVGLTWRPICDTMKACRESGLGGWGLGRKQSKD